MNYNLQPQKNIREQVDLPFDEVSYPESISVAAYFCPEIADQEAELSDAAIRLVGQYQPSPDFFHAPDNAVGLIFASALIVNAEHADDKSSARIDREKRIADNFAQLVFGDYSLTLPHEDKREVSNLSQDERIALFRRYENPELSEKLREWMRESEDLGEVREALGIEQEISNEFVPVVLRAGADYHMKGIGAAASGPDMSAKIAEWKLNAKQFMNEQGSAEDDSFPFAWVSTLNGEKYLCFPEPIAAALLDPESVGFEDDGSTADYLKGLIKHEYVHVQRDLQLNDPNDSEKAGVLGGLLTEYQAEVFSGFYFDYAYPDIYAFVQRVEMAGGINIQEMMRSHNRDNGENKAEFYFSCINTIGLIPSAMLVGAMTEDDIQYQSTKAGRQLAEVFGEFSLPDELVVRNGWEGIMAYFERENIEMTEKIVEFWRNRLDKLHNS